MRTTIAVRSLLFSFILLALSPLALAQIGVGISVGFGPPAIPVYEQPICPEDGYLWTPGYWNYDDGDGYYWVPGTWVEPPQVGFLWTPGYWGWGGNAFLFHEGYWGSEVGFYGGINYGFGYGGNGYEGGRWEGGRFSYNTYVNHVNTSVIRNTYNTRVNVSENRVSFNGGTGGVEARATAREQTFASERHVGPVAAQAQHVQAARSNPELRASANQGKPPIAATSRPGDFKAGAVASKEAGGEYKAPANNAARGNEARPGTEARPATENRAENTSDARANANNHANQLQPHTSTPPNTGNAKTDKKYQQQQNKLAAKQTQDHAKLQNQQEKEHQQAAKKNYSDAQKAPMERRHTQQTQQLEQTHANQQKQMEQRQAPRQAAPRPANGAAGGKPRG
jgi:WXXGXW repeat (2 copies)